MKKAAIIILLVLVAGCTTLPTINNCPNPTFIDNTQSQYSQMKQFIRNYTDNEDDGLVSQEGLDYRSQYEKIRQVYMDLSTTTCENSTGSFIPITYTEKCFDLIYGVNPSTFMNSAFLSKMVTLAEQGLVEHVSAGQYSYEDMKTIRIWDIDNELEVQLMAEEYNFNTVEFEDSEQTFFTVYYTNNYEDEYGWHWTGIYFQALYNGVFAGQYSYEDMKTIRIWDIDNELEVQLMAEEYNFNTVEFEDSEQTFFTVYYTNNYEDEYGWHWTGIYFQALYNGVFAGYRTYYTLPEVQEEFEQITITNEEAKLIFNEICINRFQELEIECAPPEINVGPYSCCTDENNNNECDSMETELPEHYCGDGYCQSDETHINCLTDCS